MGVSWLSLLTNITDSIIITTSLVPRPEERVWYTLSVKIWGPWVVHLTVRYMGGGGEVCTSVNHSTAV